MFKNSKIHYDSKTNKTDSVIYFNANVYNDPVGTQQAKLARFSQTISSGSIVDLPENYYMSIVRFAISHALIPLYQFKNNFYSVTITPTGQPPSREFLNYGDALVGNYSQYGYNQPVFYYSQLANMISEALKRAHVAAGLVDPPPFVHYGNETERFTLYVPNNNSYYDGTDTFATISFNSNLFQQLQLLNSTFNGFNQPNGLDYTINYFSDPGGFNLYTVPPNSYHFFTQERTALYLLNEVQSIVFTSTTLNVTKEYTGKNDGSGNAGSIAILADFVPDQSTGRDLSEYQYNVQGPPRLVNLTNTIPITEIDYQVGIRFRDGTIVPLYLEPGETCEVKFGFFKKSLYDNNFEY